MADFYHERHIPYIRKNLARGCTQQAIADALGIPAHSVASIARRLGLVRNKQGGKWDRPKPLPVSGSEKQLQEQG